MGILGLSVFIYFSIPNARSYAELPPFLQISLKSYASTNLRYVICVSGEDHLRESLKKEFALSFANVEIFSDTEILSDHSRLLLGTLWKLWNEKQIRANYAPSEYHCFARWLALNDLYNKNIIGNTELVLAHDWDDCFLGDPDILASSISRSLSQSHLTISDSKICAYCSESDVHPLFSVIQPHLMVLNRNQSSHFSNTLTSLLIDHKKFMYTRLFADMNLWAYCISLSMRDAVPSLFQQLYHIMEGEYYVCDNIRSFKNLASSSINKDSIFIPPQINYLENGATHMDYVKLLFGDKVYIETADRGLIPAFNLQFQGVEGKYLASCLQSTIHKYIG